MLFLEALKQLENGVAMRRSIWTDSDGYIVIMPDMAYVWKIVLLPNPNAGNFIFSIEDFNADDWVPLNLVVEAVEATEEVAEVAEAPKAE